MITNILKIPLIEFILGLILGITVSYILYRIKSYQSQLRLKMIEAENEEKSKKLEAFEAEIKNLLEEKARAEQDAKRLAPLEEEFKKAMEENSYLKSELARTKKEAEMEREKILWLEKAEAHLRDAFEALSQKVLRESKEDFLTSARNQIDLFITGMRGDLSTHRSQLESLIGPLEKALSGLNTYIRELEEKREGAYQKLTEQISQLMSSQIQLQDATTKLAHALRSPVVRGRWGEYQLRRIVEMAQMVGHVDFKEQAGTDTGRPDMIIYLPNEGILPVDAKAPMEFYLRAVEAEDEKTRTINLQAHARSIRDRIKELGRKEYWAQFSKAPDFVIMFLPNEASLSSAFESDPSLMEFAIQNRVFLATPLSLLALLKAIAYGWQRMKMAENAKEVSEIGIELYKRLRKFIDHLKDTGTRLAQTVECYNNALGSLETRVFPCIRKLAEKVGTDFDQKTLDQIESRVKLPKEDREMKGEDGESGEDNQG